jgi:peptide/nickel transport system substrate-binding protein
MKIWRKFRFYPRLIIAFIQKQRRKVLFGILVGILSFWLLPKFSFLFPTKNIERIGVVGRFTLAELPLEVQNLIGSGLTQVLEDGSVVPALAESWEVRKDGQEYDFTLRENLSWQDRSSLTAEEINYNFSDVTTAPLDEKTIRFQLKEPFSPFPAIVSRPIFKEGFVGTGDYKVKNLTRRGQIVEKIELMPLDSSLPRLVFRFYPTEEAARTAFKLGEIKTIKEISQAGNLREWSEIKISDEVKEDRYVAIFFNTQNGDLEDKSLRQALAYAINKQDWKPRAYSPINPNSWAYNPGVKPYDFDPTNAQTLFNKSQEGKEDEEKFKEIELATVPSLLSIAEQIAEDWKELGVETKVRVINVIPDDFQALLVTQSIPADPDQYTLWHSTQATNLTGYKNPKIDKLLEDGRKVIDQEERKDIYFDFQRFIVEDTPAIFLYHPTLYTIERGE